jgi:MFS superfamily sulfate permease-like transporter
MNIATYIVTVVIVGFWVALAADIIANAIKEVTNTIKENTKATMEVAKAIKGIPNWKEPL